VTGEEEDRGGGRQGKWEKEEKGVREGGRKKAAMV